MAISAQLAPLAGLHYFRLEISGGHTGSAFRWQSDARGTLREIQEALDQELAAPDGLSFILFEECSVMLEVYESGALVWREDIRKRITVEGVALDAWLRDHVTPEGEIAPEHFEIEFVLAEGRRATMPWEALDLPVLAGAPLANETEARVELKGKAKRHPYGQIGGWDGFDQEKLPDF